MCGLLGVALAATSCSRGSDAKGADEVAGTVVEVSGSVTAQREGAEPRALEKGAPVFKNDTVVTAASAAVTIVLAHNEARWQIAENQSHVVERSIAWRAPKGAGSSSLDEAADDSTAAAGRHSENEAAHTAGTAIANADPPPASEAPAAAAPSDPVEPRAVRAKKAKRRAKSSTPPPVKRKAAKNEKATLGAIGTPPIKKPRAIAKPAPVPAPESARQPADAVAKPRASATRGAATSAADLIRKKLRTCYVLDGDDKTGKVSVTVTVNKSGAITAVSAKAADGLGAVATCVRGKLKGRVVSSAKTGKISASMTFR